MKFYRPCADLDIAQKAILLCGFAMLSSSALSGKPDEFGTVYNVNTYDKSQGTDLNGGSYWYQRVVKYGKMYNQGGILSNARTLNYKMDKRNLYWPIPNAAITANKRGVLKQNFGYTGYNAGTPVWSTWQEAVADEDTQ